MSYLLFIFFEFLIYFIIINKAENKRGLYYVALVSLLLIPFFKVGSLIDFVMRASIPALVVLFLLVVDALQKYITEGKKLLAGCLIALLVIGGLTAQHEFARTAISTVIAGKNKKPVTADEINILSCSLRDNFFTKTDESFFFKYIAKDNRQ